MRNKLYYKPAIVRKTGVNLTSFKTDKYGVLFGLCLIIALVGTLYLGNDFLIPSGVLLYGAFYLKHKADKKKYLNNELNKIDKN